MLTVSQLTRQIRSTLEEGFGEVWVEGEISNHRLQSSGHQYFTLKDEGAQLSCVLFRGNAMRSGARLADGVQVQACGELSVYEQRGQYQLVVKLVQPKGQGMLQARFEALKQRLSDEGLFAEGHKQPIPKVPLTVALVTSPTGAAVRDMLNILTRRAPWVKVIIFPVRVQGAGAEVEIARALELLNQSAANGLPAPDTIIVGRGGGSLEDLWCFNEELVARAIFASKIPVVSAVGHEIDFTIADFVADMRAPTPSAAAELVAPDIAELKRHLDSINRTLKTQVTSVLDHLAEVTELTAKGPLRREPERMVRDIGQWFDDLRSRWQQAAQESLRNHRDTLADLQQALARFHPARVVAEASHRVEMGGHRLTQTVTSCMQRVEDETKSREHMLRLLGPEGILARGFSYTTDAKGRVLTDANAVGSGEVIVTRLANGTLRSTTQK